MKRLLAMAALAAAMLAAIAATTNRADALPIGAPSGLLQAVDEVAQIEQVGWHGGRHHSFYYYWGTGYFPTNGYFWPHRFHHPWNWGWGW